MIFSRKSKEKSERQRLSFKKQVYDAGMIPNLVTGVVTVAYMLATVRIPAGNVLPMVLWAVVISIVLQFLVAPLTNKMITQKVSDDLEWFYTYETSERERTSLLKQVMGIPEKIGIEVFIVFYAGVICWTLICRKFADTSAETVIMSLFSGFIGAYSGFVFAIEQTQKICSSHASVIVEKGVSEVEVAEKHTFGISSTIITVIHIFAPIIIADVFCMIFSWHCYINKPAFPVTLFKLCVIVIMNIIFFTVHSVILFKRMMKSINFTKNILLNMNRKNLYNIKRSPTDLSNEFMYNIHLINTISDILQTILHTTSEISMQVVESSNELSVISKETSVTSLEQNSGVKELLAAMEESDSMARNISSKIEEVSLVAKKTTEVINDGFDILKNNIHKLSEIRQANEITLDGIKTLSDKISGISDIAGIINSIADQTNIIAFNAELEASRAGDSGKNFHLVAAEIRRLTNNTIQSTNEIRSKIIEIQHSSEKLLLSSQSGNKKIIEGNEIVDELYDNFTDLRNSSAMADSSSEEINKIIQQQTVAFEQIVVTLRQLSVAAETFSVSTQSINSFAENLCEISEKLKTLQPDEDEMEA